MGLFCALVFAATFFLRIPAPTGYINLGDSVILLAALWMGTSAIIPAAAGSALADLFSYPLYAPATLVLKALMALCAVALMRATKGGRAGRLIAFCAAELIMIAGYFLYDCLMFHLAGALVNLPGNIVQAAAGVILGFMLTLIPNPLSQKSL